MARTMQTAPRPRPSVIAHPNLFSSLKYHVQTVGVESRLFRELRDKLDIRGAQYFHDPEDPECKIIFAFPPDSVLQRTYIPKGQARPLEVCRAGPSNAWTLDDLCTHLGRRNGDKEKRRQFVVAAGWVDDCLEQGEFLRPGRWGKWELLTSKEPRPSTASSIAPSPITSARTSEAAYPMTPRSEDGIRPPSHSAVTAALSAGPASINGIAKPPLSIDTTAANQPAPPVPRVPAQPMISTPITTPRPAPESAQTVAAGVFTPLSQDKLGPARGIHVVEYEDSWLLERTIKAEGGIIEDERYAVFVIFHPTTVDLHGDLLARLGRYQMAVSTAWAKDSIRLGRIQNTDSYKIVPPALPSTQTEETATRSNGKRPSPDLADIQPKEDPDAVPVPSLQPPKKGPRLDPSYKIKRKSDGSSDQRNINRTSDGRSGLRSPGLPVQATVYANATASGSKDTSRAQSTSRSASESHRASPYRTPEAGKEWKIRRVVDVLWQWSQQGYPGTRTGLLLEQKPSEQMRDHVGTFQRHREDILSRLSARGCDTGPGSKLAGTTLASRIQAMRSTTPHDPPIKTKRASILASENRVGPALVSPNIDHMPLGRTVSYSAGIAGAVARDEDYDLPEEYFRD